MRYRLLILLTFFALQIANAQNKPNSNPFIASPYLQIGREPSATSLSLLWHAADVNANWSVEYSATAKGDWKKTEAPTFKHIAVAGIAPHRVYNTVFSGLTSGSNFFFRVLLNNKVVFSAEGHAPRSATQPYRFVTFGDIGAETPDQKLLAVQAYQSKPDLVIVPGDIVYENGLISQYRSKFWPIYNADKVDTAGAPLMRSVPFVGAVGNHDVDNRNIDQHPDGLAYFMYWDQPLNGPVGAEGGPLFPALQANEVNKKAFLEAAGDAYPKMTNYSFNYGNAHWLIIDSNPYVDFTDKALTDWVTKDLASAKDATWRFVIFHHPGFSSSIVHAEQQHMRLLSPIFEANKVDVVFSGHVHNYQRSFPLTFAPAQKGTLLVGGKNNKLVRGRVVPGLWTLDKSYNGKTITKPNGIIYIVTGAGGQDLYDVEQNDNPDSWQKFTDKFISNVHSLTVTDVEGNKLSIRQVAADGKEIDAFVITK